MKIKDIKTDTVIYAVGTGQYRPRHRAVVLDTAKWRPISRRVGAGFHSFDTTGYRPDPQAKGYGDKVGMPVVRVGSNHSWKAEADVTDAQLIDLAAQAAVALNEGRLPQLPEGVYVELLRPQDVDMTWAEFERHEALRKERQEQEQALRLERESAERDARDRLRVVLGDKMPGYLNGMSWTRLEQICQAYAAAQVQGVS